MKIRNKEFDAAMQAYDDTLDEHPASLEAAIIAALTVRKQRKASKRERQRKENDKQVVESVGISIERGMNEAERADFERKTVEMMRDLSTLSKAPEWDGNASAFDAAMKPKA